MSSSASSFCESDVDQGWFPPLGLENDDNHHLFQSFDDIWSGHGLHQSNLFDPEAALLSPDHQQLYHFQFTHPGEIELDAVCSVVQAFAGDGDEEVSSISPFPESNVELLNICDDLGSMIKDLDAEEEEQVDAARELSTEEIMKLAAARFVELSSYTEDDSPACEQGLSDLTDEQAKDVDLAVLLLDAAEKVRNQQYDLASNLIDRCYELCSSTGNPVQRVVYYFCDALQERIRRDRGMEGFKRQRDDGMIKQDVVKVILTDHPIQLVTHNVLPFSQLMQFTSIQTILEKMASAKRIHLIDLSIKHGIHWTILMHSLATRSACPIEYLKISAVGRSGEAIAATGKRLSDFAETLNLSFSFKPVIVSDMIELKEDMFEVEKGEAIGVFSTLDMSLMVARPQGLENVIRVMRRLKPCVMTVADVEAKHNSPSFINRFAEALFFYSSFFDAMDCYMDRDDENRLFLEGSFHSQGIHDIVATEGTGRVVRHVGLGMWRKYFARFGLEEIEVTKWSVYQASLLVKKFAHSSSCTLGRNGKSLSVGWKGRPLFFVSAWKFQ